VPRPRSPCRVHGTGLVGAPGERPPQVEKFEAGLSLPVSVLGEPLPLLGELEPIHLVHRIRGFLRLLSAPVRPSTIICGKVFRHCRVSAPLAKTGPTTIWISAWCGRGDSLSAIPAWAARSGYEFKLDEMIPADHLPGRKDKGRLERRPVKGWKGLDWGPKSVRTRKIYTDFMCGQASNSAVCP
jgi:hypothetical protein